MRRAVVAAAALGAVVVVAGFVFSGSSDKPIVIRIRTEATDLNTCLLLADVQNGSDYHLTTAQVVLDQASVKIPDVAAKSGVSGIQWAKLRIPEDFASCDEVAKSFAAKEADLRVTDCTVPGISEGECQRLIKFESGINLGKLMVTEAKLEAKQAEQNLAVGAYVSRDDFLVDLFYDIPGPGTEAKAAHQSVTVYGASNAHERNTPPTAVNITQVHKDGRGIADWYQVRFGSFVGLGWVNAPDLQAALNSKSD